MKPIKISFVLGSMSPKETAEQMLVDLRGHIVKLRDDERNRAMSQSTIKMARFHEGQAMMADTLLTYLGWIEVVE